LKGKFPGVKPYATRILYGLTCCRFVRYHYSLNNERQLFQNHPNPFNPTTSIEYDVASAGHVTVEIYDVSGRLVRRLVDGYKHAGRYTAVWDGRDTRGAPAHTGIYLYRMSATGYTSPAKKMLLLK
jgi:hypothetical protein